MDRLTSMAVFLRVAEDKSFAAAAAALDLSPTMVANHVRALEQHLGAQLIQRTTRRHALTDIGRAYLDRCRDVLDAVEAADSAVEAVRTRPEGILRVTAPVSYGAHRLMPAIAEYSRTFPAVHVDLHLSDRVIDLVEEGFHVGIRSGPALGEGLIAVPLQPSIMFAAASPAYLERHGTPSHPRDLAGHDCLAFAAWGPGHAWRFSRDGETVAVPIRGPLTTNNGQSLLTAAIAGMGVVVQADVLLSSALENGALVRLLPDWALPTRPVQLIYPRRMPPSAKIRSFVQFIGARLGPKMASGM